MGGGMTKRSQVNVRSQPVVGGVDPLRPLDTILSPPLHCCAGWYFTSSITPARPHSHSTHNGYGIPLFTEHIKVAQVRLSSRPGHRTLSAPLSAPAIKLLRTFHKTMSPHTFKYQLYLQVMKPVLTTLLLIL